MMIAVCNGPVYVKVNGGELRGGTPPGAGLVGYRAVIPASSSMVLNGVTTTGALQYYGSLSASVSSNGLSAVVPNGVQELGSIDVTAGEVANDMNPRLLISRLSGDSNILASWVKDLVNPLRVTFSSDGTDRRRDAVFRISVFDGAGRTTVAGDVYVTAVHGDPSYSVTVDPTSLTDTVHLPRQDGVSGTKQQTFNGYLAGGVGPFVYSWSTNVGVILTGASTPSIEWEVDSGVMAATTAVAKDGLITLTITDQGNGNDQLIKTIPVHVVFVTDVDSQVVTGTGALNAAAADVEAVTELQQLVVEGTGALTPSRAQVAASGTITPVLPFDITITPSEVNNVVAGPGVSPFSYTFNISLSANVTGGVSPYVYQWEEKAGWTIISGQYSPNVTYRKVIGPVAVDTQITVTDSLSLTVEDDNALGTKVKVVPISLTVTNYHTAQTILGSGSPQAQSAAVVGVGYKTAPAALQVYVSPGHISDYASSTNSSYTFTHALTCSISNGIGPYLYSWSKSGLGGFITANGLDHITHQITLSANQWQETIETGQIILTVTDLGRAGQPQAQGIVSCSWDYYRTGIGPEP